MKISIFLALLLFSTGRVFAANVGSPQAVNVKFYEMWVGANADCTSMTRVYSNSNPSYQNVSGNVAFGQIVIPDGIYHCIALKMSDLMQIVPDFNSDDGNCVRGITYTRDLFRAGDISTSPDGAITLNGSGNPVDPGQVENGMYIYLSTSGNDTTNSWSIPSQPGILPSPYVVNGDNTATLVWDMTNGVEDIGIASGGCSVETVTYRFRRS